MLRRIINLEIAGPTSVRIVFDDGAAGIVDLASNIAVGGVFAALRDRAEFVKATLGGRGRWIEWPTGAEQCADALWRQVRNLSDAA